ncbi:MAG: hypothetical protein KF852_08270 [Saprospiraceae bacterium]|nr:hypothetical protein [Saprospiraceae bacterium]
MSSPRIAFALAFLLLFLNCRAPTPAQNAIVVQHIEPRTGVTQLSEGISVPEEDAGYTLILPASGRVEGVIVMVQLGQGYLKRWVRNAPLYGSCATGGCNAVSYYGQPV